MTCHTANLFFPSHEQDKQHKCWLCEELLVTQTSTNVRIVEKSFIIVSLSHVIHFYYSQIDFHLINDMVILFVTVILTVCINGSIYLSIYLLYMTTTSANQMHSNPMPNLLSMKSK